MKAKYALRALGVLASHAPKTMQSKTIAKQADVPTKFLEAILSELKSNRIVDSKRGIFGGYFLNKPAPDITIGEIIRITDGSLAPLRCASLSDYRRCDDCADENACAIRKVMLEVRHAISGVLDSRSIADLLAMSPAPKQGLFT